MTKKMFTRAYQAGAVAAVLAAGAMSATAQENNSPFSFLDRVFKGNDAAAVSETAAPAPAQAPQRFAQNSPSDLVVRIDRLEEQIRQLTGTIEQLQYRNQQLEQQLSRMQPGGAPPAVRPPNAAAAPLPPISNSQSVAGNLPPVAPPQGGMRRSDAFDPSQNPNAPGAPQSLGTLNGPGGMAPGGGTDAQIGAPGGRQYGAPLDLSTMGGAQQGGYPPYPANPPYGGNPVYGVNQPPGGAPYNPNAPQSSDLPPPPARATSATGAVASANASVLPPSNSPRDQFDLGYGYILRKEYAAAEDALQTFLAKFPNDKLAPDAQFWLGESRFQRQRYDAAAEAFLQVSTKHASNPKAPEAMLRLGQSLAALNQRDMACATLAEVGRKFPRASASVKQGVEREQKRAKCGA